MQAQFTLAGGEQRQLTGFQSVSRDKLKALTGKQLEDLAKTDELELTHIQLQSMNNFVQMLQRRSQKAADASK